MSTLVIESDFIVAWKVPVQVRVGRGFVESVRGPEEGLQYLSYRWPVTSGTCYDEARLKCLRALQKRFPCEAARDAFILAAQEARMLAS
ncbi:DUF982 domain-containing protein [Rhizobium laguerreae]|uniref:DUF982 domain-containing protein n=1 Tax=Rhizobium laguerreae TaxID=1076926 RepID=UPI001C928857|nr:DUF982 domain-containing protein [Rhizobium laguerreae]MBY3417726.1 DUF982 domain-containing protein [Rhizobium laguerreae]